jgi:hypothetical protein
MGDKAYFVDIPTSAGTGSEVTPFAVITDEQTGVKYPLADYELMPDMAIVDADMMMNAPKGLTSASGIDAVSHALEAYASIMATDYTDGLAIQALKVLFEYLPKAYESAVTGVPDKEAREKMANAATMAGMAFANAFLGVMHSMAHKLGAFHHIYAVQGLIDITPLFGFFFGVPFGIFFRILFGVFFRILFLPGRGGKKHGSCRFFGYLLLRLLRRLFFRDFRGVFFLRSFFLRNFFLFLCRLTHLLLCGLFFRFLRGLFFLYFLRLFTL